VHFREAVRARAQKEALLDLGVAARWPGPADLAAAIGAVAGDSEPQTTIAPPSSVALAVQVYRKSHIWRAFMAKGFVAITVERCKGCGFCVEFCPTHVLALSSAFNSTGYHPPHVVDAEKCSGCDLCGMYCPDFAIFGGRYAR
jgi:2-oxoglutarate ferredoxin oxidoreductase subunit delta